MAMRDLNHLPFQRLSWTDLCPLGRKYRNTKLEDVPCGFFVWAYEREWLYEKYPALHDFIKRNWDEINETAKETQGEFDFSDE